MLIFMAKVSLDRLSLIACPIAHNLSVFGDPWCLLILRDAHMGLTRFDEFHNSLGIAPSVLTKRLTTLVEEGVLAKHRYSTQPPREEYLLTEAGQDILPILFMLREWGLTHSPCSDYDKRVVFIDSETSEEIQPVVIDKVTGVEIGKRVIQKKFK